MFIKAGSEKSAVIVNLRQKGYCDVYQRVVHAFRSCTVIVGLVDVNASQGKPAQV